MGMSLLGVNLSGGEFGNAETGRYGWDYVYPTNAEVDHLAADGLNVIRLPFLWERVQPTEDGPLNQTELSRIDAVVDYAASKGIKVILDPHDYGSGYGNLVGSSGTPDSAFADFWGKLAAHYENNSNVIFGLMNEPNQQTPAQWLGAANDAISSIRAAGATQEILVPGTDWDGAWTWTTSGNSTTLASGVVDPDHNMAFEVHQYLDSDGSGTHETVVSTTIGVERLTSITQWAEATGNKLFLGEFGVASDQESLSAMSNMLTYMNEHSDVWQGATYWAGGPWMGSYMYSAEPTNGVDTPQMDVLIGAESTADSTTLSDSGQTASTSSGLAAGSTPTAGTSSTATAGAPSASPGSVASSATAPSGSAQPAPPSSVVSQGGTPAADPSAKASITSVSVYRFLNVSNGEHFYTASTSERDTLVATRSDLHYEGVSMDAVDATANSAATPVYRFLDTGNGSHFFTASASELSSVLATRSDMAYEGVAFYEHSTPQTGDTPVYRFLDTANGSHFYTNSTDERASVLATRSDMHYEGIAFYAPANS